jgi:hypothetical protein
MKKRDHLFQPGQSGNPASRWQPGQSGNPAGVSKRRAQFGKVFIDALAQEGTAEEAAALVWEAAREREPWAIQLIFQRLAPADMQSIRLVHEVDDEDKIDYRKFTDEQLAQLEVILQQANAQPVGGADGEGEALAL